MSDKTQRTGEEIRDMVKRVASRLRPCPRCKREHACLPKNNTEGGEEEKLGDRLDRILIDTRDGILPPNDWKWIIQQVRDAMWLRHENKILRQRGRDDRWKEPVGGREVNLARRIYRRGVVVGDLRALNKAIEAVLRVRRERSDPTMVCEYCHFHRDLHYPHPETGKLSCKPNFGPNYFTPLGDADD